MSARQKIRTPSSWEAGGAFLKTKCVSKSTRRSPRIKGKLKVLIVRLAVTGLLPTVLAEWFIRVGGLKHD